MALNTQGSGHTSVTAVHRIKSKFDSKNMTGDLTNRNNTTDNLPALYNPKGKTRKN